MFQPPFEDMFGVCQTIHPGRFSQQNSHIRRGHRVKKKARLPFEFQYAITITSEKVFKG